MVAADSRSAKVTSFVRGIESAPYELGPDPDMPRPWQDNVPERVIGSSLKTLQSALFDQIVPQLTETDSGLIVAEARPGDDREPFISEARRITVTVLKAEIHYSANYERR